MENMHFIQHLNILESKSILNYMLLLIYFYFVVKTAHENEHTTYFLYASSHSRKTEENHPKAKISIWFYIIAENKLRDKH